MESVMLFLYSHPLFRYISKTEISVIANFIELVQVGANENLFLQGDNLDKLYLIYKGAFYLKACDKGGDTFADTRNAGEFLCENIVEKNFICPYSALSIEKSQLIVFDGPELRKALFSMPELHINLLKIAKQGNRQINFLKLNLKNNKRKKKRIAFPAFITEPSLPYLLSKLNLALGGEKQIEYCKSVAFLSRELARFLFPAMDNILYWAGLLHDIGKLSLEYSVLAKINSGEKLNSSEAEQLKLIFVKSLEIISPDPDLTQQMGFISFLNEERYTSMPLETQILKVAKDFTLMSAECPREQVLVKMKNSGDKYNPVVLETLEESFDKYQNLRLDAILNNIRILNTALDKKDGFSLAHCDFVSRVATMFAKKMGFSREEIEEIKLGSELHNVGMIDIPYEILNKKTPLTQDEFELIKLHPQYLSDFFAKNLPAMESVGKFTMYHHENWDGSGYPYSIGGEEIPLFSRILRIADVYCALRAYRVYRFDSNNNYLIYDTASALKIMSPMSSKAFDPELFKNFRDIMKKRIIKSSSAEL